MPQNLRRAARLGAAQRDTIARMKPIAHIHTDLPQKFGIPRNSFLAPHLQGRIMFEPEYALSSAVTGIDSFSHLWLLWRFENGEPGGGAADVADGGRTRESAAGNYDALNRKTPDRSAIKSTALSRPATNERETEGDVTAETGAGNACAETPASAPASPKPAHWSPTVRPPRLGGAERVGVFATRSPFRPNPIGLTCVKLDRVELTDAGPVIHVLGADLRDGTPIYDIKPYIPFADCHPDACGGWIEDAPWHKLDVDFPEHLQAEVPAGKLPGLTEVLRQDPRRAGSKHEPTRVYHLAYAGLDVAFTVDGDVLHVVCVS